ncbi:MAG: mannose-6-phosphate isomerase, class [Pelosinus sp.]|jgi:mannose-6-phosphate isomerase|nr:mannose-6-phosphate isomerase, class [Pelosinus sp.]
MLFPNGIGDVVVKDNNNPLEGIDLYPLKFHPVYKEVIWGGSQFKNLFGRILTSNKIGESWEICTHKNGASVISNGHLAGKTLQQLIELDADQIIGKKAKNKDTFPLLIKYIDAHQNLSVQVHPNDEYAQVTEGEWGKTEAWYILHAPENAQIVYGLREHVSKADFLQAIQDDRVSEVLRHVSIKNGDIVFIPSGTIHALLSGVVICEVQQNSDTTYRVYDYNRINRDGKKRELHIDKAIDVINFGEQPDINFGKKEIECEYFSIKTLSISGEERARTQGKYIVYCILDGWGEFNTQDHHEIVHAGETILVPAIVNEVIIKGHMKLLKITGS